jgi:heat shock protein HtpX
MAAYGLYTHIASNKFRSILLLIGLFVLIYVLVFAGALIAEVIIDSDEPAGYYIRAAVGDLYSAVPIATLVAAAWIVVAYFCHQWMIDAVTGGRDVTRQEQPRLYNLLENLCISRGIPMPKLKIVDSDALNAFATGLNRSQYAISVTSGLMNTLDDRELEAVLGHELTHIRNGDVQMMVVAVIIAGVVGFFGELIFRVFFNNVGYGGWGWSSGSSGSSSSSSSSSSDRKGSGGGAIIVIIVAIALIMLAWLLSQVVRLALSRSRIPRRRRFGRADQGSGRHDLGAAQDREPRRIAGRDLRCHGAVPRQSARRLCRPVRDPSLDPVALRQAGAVCRRPRSGPAGAADAC